MSRLHTPRARLVAVAASLALLAGCQQGDDASPDGTGPSGNQDGTSAEEAGDRGETGEAGSSASSAPAGTARPPADEDAPEGLEDFYGQELGWSSCEGSFECAGLMVPLDYQDPGGATIELALLRSPAVGQAQGSLVVNPGGPGASGVDYAMLAPMVVSAEVREVYDVVGFDPRGVARSAPIECFTDEQMDTLLGADPTPETPEEEAESRELMQQFAAACAENAPELVGHVSTVEAARDMDILRSALGDDQLAYLGASYGTFLGATYASLFPERVGRLVLDGAIDPTISGLEVGLGQAEGFERATRAYVEDCVAGGDCPLGDDVDTAMAAIPAFLDDLDATPLPVRGDVVEELTEGWGMYGIIVAMYDQAGWPILSQAFAQAQEGDGTMLMFLANLYASRSSDGSYDGNGMQAIYAVNCLDRPAGEEELDPDAVLEQFEEVSPTWGRYLAGEGACQYWPAEAQETIEDYSASDADPIVVIGTTRDPATPYEWAVSLADILDPGVLVSFDGDGHTAYGRSNDCVQDAVDSYLVEGTVPEDGLNC
ncbi:alpha/beta hydrolase [Ornithinimicrobium sufpigmenti]|uniref:alpha/beta hydrolase n=1 Tax=Ornithinimicrobium sufpigmenti TaxID=2508882 RepID=UPI001EDE9EBE|nr:MULTISPECIES: alpha/beta hydrolase [unclassified Ornithinimicrobium]